VALQEQGLLDKAEPVFTQALGVYERTSGTASPDYGQTLNNLAVLYLLKGDFDRAAPLYPRALDIREKALGQFHPDVGRSLAAYAVFLARTGRTAEAIATQARHIDVIEHNLAEELETGSEAQKALSLESLSDSIEITLSLRNALGAAEQDAQRLALLTVMLRKGRLLDMLASTSGALRHSFTGADRHQFDRLSQLKADLARVFLQAPEQITGTASQQKIQQLNDQIASLESTLLGRRSSTTPDVPITIAAVQSAIPRDAVLIDFFRYRSFDPDQSVAAKRFGAPRYVAYALRHDGPPEWIELGESSSIDSAVAAFHRALTRTGDGSVSEAAAALRERLTNPILHLAGNAREIIVSPEGELNLIPFAALTDASGEYLVRRFLFTYVTSASELIRRPAAVRPASAPIIIANPAYGRSPSINTGLGTFEQLPGAEQEAADIKKLLPHARVVLGVSASEHFVKNVHAPRVLHIATHGYFFEAGLATLDGGTRAARPKGRQDDLVDSVPPMVRTGLAFAGANRGRVGPDGEDGILTAIEAASLDLDGTELVFLSACDTGRGVIVPGDSIYGLRRAFVIAGSSNPGRDVMGNRRRSHARICRALLSSPAQW
jgi:CHAT domain-containing protein